MPLPLPISNPEGTCSVQIQVISISPASVFSTSPPHAYPAASKLLLFWPVHLFRLEVGKLSLGLTCTGNFSSLCLQILVIFKNSVGTLWWLTENLTCKNYSFVEMAVFCGQDLWLEVGNGKFICCGWHNLFHYVMHKT